MNERRYRGQGPFYSMFMLLSLEIWGNTWAVPPVECWNPPPPDMNKLGRSWRFSWALAGWGTEIQHSASLSPSREPVAEPGPQSRSQLKTLLQLHNPRSFLDSLWKAPGNRTGKIFSSWVFGRDQEDRTTDVSQMLSKDTDLSTDRHPIIKKQLRQEKLKDCCSQETYCICMTHHMSQIPIDNPGGKSGSPALPRWSKEHSKQHPMRTEEKAKLGCSDGWARGMGGKWKQRLRNLSLSEKETSKTSMTLFISITGCCSESINLHSHRFVSLSGERERRCVLFLVPVLLMSCSIALHTPPVSINLAN